MAEFEGIDGETLALAWNEKANPEVKPPEQWGFDRLMLDKGIARDVNRRVESDYRVSGLVCRKLFSLCDVTAHADE